MKKLLYAFFAIMAIAACTKEIENNGGNNNDDGTISRDQITIADNKVEFSADGGSKALAFSSTGNWTADIINTRADDWCSIKPADGPKGNAEIIITTKPNNSPDDRTATIIIKSGSASETIHVSQKQRDALTVTSSRMEVDTEGGLIEIEVKANIDYNYIIDDKAKEWISYIGMRSIKTSILTFLIKENTDPQNREGKITITSGNLSEVINIYQAGNVPAIVISQNEFIVPADGETISVDVTSNINVEVEIPKEITWIKENNTRAMSTNTYRFDIMPNEGYDERSAIIRLIDMESGTTATINVLQKQKDALTVTSSRFDVGAEGGEIEIEVKSNIPLEFEIDPDAKDWISRNATKGLESTILTFLVDRNEDFAKREGKIHITSGDFHETVTIYQKGEEPFLTIAQNEYFIPSSGETISIEIESNVNVTVELPEDNDWINENHTRSFSTDIYRFTIMPNENPDARSAKIIFRNNEHSLSAEVIVTQEAKGLIVLSKNDYTFGKNGGDLFIKLQTNAEVKVEISENAKDWILNAYTRAIEIKSLYFMILECEGSTPREGTITISAGEAVQRIKIVQDPSLTAVSQLRYKSIDGNIVIPNDTEKFGAGIISNEYTNGEGVITFDGNINAIGESAFAGCTTLSSIEIPEGITSIGDYAFSGCNNLEYISLSNTIMSIGNYAFQDCTGEIVINCNIPDAEQVDWREIGAFEGSQFTKVVISDWVTSIGSYAFYNCSSITDITMHGAVTEIGDWAFYMCENLTHINIPDSVTSLGIGAFSYCSNAESIIIPESITSISASAFSCCSSVTSIIIPESVTTIGESAFNGCRSATSLTIPDSVTEIGDSAFSGCSGVERILIPDSVIVIGNHAFYGCGGELTVNCNIPYNHYYSSGIFYNTTFTKVTIGEGVTTIGDYAFYGCNSIKSINIPKSIKYIGEEAFNGCGGDLTVSCDIPNVLHAWGQNQERGAFYNAEFSQVTIEEGVTKIGDKAFAYCPKIKRICIPESITTIGDDAFRECGGELTINCNIGNSGWFARGSFTKVIIGEGVATVGKEAFTRCYDIESIHLPSSVTTIGDNAFSSCTSLTSLYLPSSVTTIGDNAFNSCSNLTSLYLPSSVTKIGNEAFSYCTGELIFNCSISDLNHPLFENACFSIVSIGDNVKKINENLFNNNDYLKAITLGRNIISIGIDAFYDCSYLKSIYCKSAVPPALGDKKVFNYNASDRKFYVPKESVIAYKTCDNWSTYFDKIEGYEYTGGSGSLENPETGGEDVEW